MSISSQTPQGSEWWRSSVIYQVYPRSFADSNGDGIGDFAGITSRLPELKDLGVDAVWFSPFFKSPQHDAGYDVSDYCDIDPLFGTLADFDSMLETAHAIGLRVIIDLVPNHSSEEHEWFQAALAAAPGSPERERYMFRDGKGADGSEAPNNWKSVFGGPAWSRVTEADGTPGQWYLHIFDSSQPDFNWENPEIGDMFVDVLRFWLDRGVDGFRVDVAHGNIKSPGLPDIDYSTMEGTGGSMESPFFGQEGVHEIYRHWHKVLDEYEGDRVLCAEAWVHPLSKVARYVRSDEMQQAFNFGYLETPWNAAELRDVIDNSLKEFGAVGAPSTWVLSNHDVIRHATRLALVPPPPQGAGIGPESESKADPVIGERRARAATALMLALPGGAYLYQGEELGLPEVTEIEPEQRQDPTFRRTNGELYGRDGCRVPLPWESEAPAYGFNSTGETWLPQPAIFGTHARALQKNDPKSTLSMYKSALALRAEHRLGAGAVTWAGAAAGTLQFTNGAITVLANVDGEPVAVPSGEVVLASTPIVDGLVHADQTVWVRN